MPLSLALRGCRQLAPVLARSARRAASSALPRSARGAEPLLFTPGPLTTSMTVKQAMLRDLGSRDPAFLAVVREVREGLVALATGGRPSSASAYATVIVQGSGTFGVEAVLGSAIPRDGGRLLVAINGAYGERMLRIAQVLGIPADGVVFEETEQVTAPRLVEAVTRMRDAGTPYSHVAVVHHETTAGVLNDVSALGAAIAPLGPQLILDSMSAFGAYPVDMEASRVDYLVSSSNKCIEGVPGFSFAVVNKASLARAAASSPRSVALDLRAQLDGLDKTSQFRFTPPTHALLAFHQALRELTLEGGPAGRLRRYEENWRTLKGELATLGIHPLVRPEAQGAIIGTFLSPDDKAWDFGKVYKALEARGFVIYPGKTTKAETFRLGCIGRMYPEDMVAVVKALRESLQECGVSLPVRQRKA
jgi:2-aminoethylphosphonate-pyruvate transaminase